MFRINSLHKNYIYIPSQKAAKHFGKNIKLHHCVFFGRSNIIKHVCVLYLCHPLRLPLLHLTSCSTMLSLEAKKWQPVNCVPILSPLSASACPSPPLWCCLDQSSTLAKITKESEMEYTMLLADWWAMASHSAKTPVSSLCLCSPVRLIISSLGGTWGVGWAWFSLWNQAGSRCLQGNGVDFLITAERSVHAILLFLGHTNLLVVSLTFAWSHLKPPSVCTVCGFSLLSH